jgi:peptidoglycan/LPS O-acetylase OafA/YrhL
MENKMAVKTSIHKYAYIDMMRGIAVLMVVLVHVFNDFGSKWVPKNIGKIFIAGHFGVQLFFLASAFTIFNSYYSRYGKEESPNQNFFVRRFFRIAPLYYLAIIYYLWQNGIGPNFWSGGQPITVKGILLNVFFLHGFSPYYINSVVPGGWSIGVEMLFYLLVPLIFMFVKNTNKAVFFLSGVITFKFIADKLAYKLLAVPDFFIFEEYLKFYLPYQLPVFAIGIIFYYWIARGDTKISIWAWLSLIVLVAADIVTHKLHVTESIAVSAIFVGVALLLKRGTHANFFSRVIAHIGHVSYSVYLSHFAVIYCIVNYLHLPEKWGAINSYGWLTLWYLVVLALAVGVANITTKYIESPMQKLGNKLIKPSMKTK